MVKELSVHTFSCERKTCEELFHGSDPVDHSGISPEEALKLAEEHENRDSEHILTLQSKGNNFDVVLLTRNNISILAAAHNREEAGRFYRAHKNYYQRVEQER